MNGGPKGSAIQSASAGGSLITIGFSGMLTRFGIATLAALIVISILLWKRKKLPDLVPTRAWRMAVEVFALWAFQLTAGTLASISDVKAAFTGQVEAANNSLLWMLPFATAGAVVLQAFSTIRRDAADSISQAFELDKKRMNAMLSDARAERDFFDRVSRAFLKVVSKKRERLKKAAAAHPKTAATNAEIIQAFKPDEQAIALIIACWEIFDKMINPEQNGSPHRVRVAYFRVNGAGLVPLHCFDGTSHDCVALRDPGVLASFTFSHHRACAARVTSATGTTVWVPDSDEADRDSNSPFFFFDQTQRESIKSMVAMSVRLAGDEAPFDVVTVDTGRTGFFDRQQRGPEIQHVIENLAHRLQIERSIGLLVEGKQDAY